MPDSPWIAGWSDDIEPLGFKTFTAARAHIVDALDITADEIASGWTPAPLSALQIDEIIEHVKTWPERANSVTIGQQHFYIKRRHE